MIKDTQNNEKEYNELDKDDIDKSLENNGEENAYISSMEDDQNANTQSDMPDENNINKTEGDDKIDVKAIKEELKIKDVEIDKKKEEIEALKDIMKRRQADFENYKKRIVKSQEDYKKDAIKDIALDIININDDLLRAIEAAKNAKDEVSSSTRSAFVDGVSIISKRIEEMLKKYGVEEIDCLNKEFNPNQNEAVEIDESADVQKDTITKVYQKCFVMGDCVVRTARVKVTRPIRKKDEKENGSEQKGDQEGGEDSTNR